MICKWPNKWYFGWPYGQSEVTRPEATASDTFPDY